MCALEMVHQRVDLRLHSQQFEFTTHNSFFFLSQELAYFWHSIWAEWSCMARDLRSVSKSEWQSQHQTFS